MIPAFLRSELRRQEGPTGDGLRDALLSYELVSKVNLICSHISIIHQQTRMHHRITKLNINDHNATYETALKLLIELQKNC